VALPGLILLLDDGLVELDVVVGTRAGIAGMLLSLVLCCTTLRDELATGGHDDRLDAGRAALATG
jgi:hypothetical protein